MPGPVRRLVCRIACAPCWGRDGRGQLVGSRGVLVVVRSWANYTTVSGSAARRILPHFTESNRRQCHSRGDIAFTPVGTPSPCLGGVCLREFTFSAQDQPLRLTSRRMRLAYTPESCSTHCRKVSQHDPTSIASDPIPSHPSGRNTLGSVSRYRLPRHDAIDHRSEHHGRRTVALP